MAAEGQLVVQSLPEDDTEAVLAALNPAIPNVARMYDFMLGGKENYASDRAAVASLIELSATDVPHAARLNRAFLGRAVQYVAGHGVTQFLDIGAGLPTQQSVHQVAQEIAPDIRTVYVDNDPVVLAHSRALLGDNSTTAAVLGDVRDPAGIISDPAVRELIDFTRPVCILLVAVLHFVPDAADPKGILAALRDAMVPGSYLILSHGTVDGAPPEVAAKADASRVYDQATAQVTLRDAAQVAALLDGFTLVEPGLVHTSQWRPPVSASYEFDAFLAAVGRKD
ncbi:MAG TPA: SAM-dependent methyltransferase [Streptosporangiaceae bacterium]|nr:SAM-dependent methyltransferase [Streptosporangiaceae bacterium]